MPIYIGVSGEEKSGIALGTENYLAVNSQVSETAQKASIDFLTWLLTGEGAKMLVDNSVVSVSPYPAFSELTPADPLGKETAQFLANKMCRSSGPTPLRGSMAPPSRHPGRTRTP